TPAPAHDLPAALSGLRCGTPAARPGPALLGRTDWYARRVADLDPRPALSPPRSLPGAGDRVRAGWDVSSRAQSGLLGSGQATGDSVSGQTACRAAPDCTVSSG